MNGLKKNLMEFVIAGAILYFVIPFAQEEWEYRSQILNNPQFRQFLITIKKEKKLPQFDELFKYFNQQKRYNRPKITLSVPTHATSNKIVSSAMGYIDAPYNYGGTSKSGIDCSGLILCVFNENGIKLPRTASRQFQVGQYIDSIEKLQPGDLAFFSYSFSGGPTHVGIYVGDYKMIHASSYNYAVVCANIDNRHHRRRFIGGTRILNN